MRRCVPLEPAADKVCDQPSVPPSIFQLPPEEGRKVLEKAQDMPVYRYPASVSFDCVNTGKWGSIPVYFISPKEEKFKNIIFYIHGAGWVFGSFHTHEKLVRELAARTDSLVIFPEYSRSPEAKYPMAIAMVLMSLMRHGPVIHRLLLYYPVTNACFDTPSYRQFATDYYLYREGMKWFWNQYTDSCEERNEITASPLRAGSDCLKGFPPTMIINGQADVLRSEGEAFGEKLRCAGVDVTAVQIQGTIHDFVMLNALDQTNACRTAMDVSVGWLNRADADGGYQCH